MRLQNDAVIDNRYRVIDRLGSGGMADVYLAEDQHLGRKVAVKVMHERFAQDQEFVERFHREASAAAGLQHKNVVSVFDRGQLDGTYYIAMEYLPGRNLKEIIRQEAPLAPQRAIALTLQILAAARFAHRRGVVHRDIKPQNMIVDDEGTLKVTDFGIARAGASDVTEAGAILGTAQYTSPEQAQGLEVGPQSDLYSVGVVLFEMLTGRVPFTGDTAVSIALKHVSEPPPHASELVSSVGPALDAIVVKALAKEPSHRFRDADEFTAAVEAARDGVTAPVGAVTEVFTAPTVVAPPTRVIPAPIPVAERTYVEEEPDRRKFWWALVALSAVVLGILIYLLLPNNQVTVPYVEGRALQDAQAKLGVVGLRSSVTRRQNSAPANEVIAQDPARDTKVDEGSTVRLIVSSGPGMALVPDVRGLSKARATRQLKLKGFNVNSDETFSSKIEKGLAVKTVPAAGDQIERGTTIDLFISKGPKQVEVPDVTALDRDAAEKVLEDAGFKVEVNDRDSSEPENAVLEQSPAAGTEADDGSTVTIVVSTGQVDVPDVTGLDEQDAVAELRDAGLKVRTVDVVVSDPDDDGRVQEQSPASGKVAEGTTVEISIGRFDPTSVPQQ